MCLSPINNVTVRGVDYDFTGEEVFNFTSATGSTACIDISIVDDLNYQGDHSFVVMLSNTPPMGKRTVGNYFSDPEGPIIGMISSTIVDISDPEGIIHCYCILVYFIVNFSHTDAIIEFVNETIYTEETGTLSVGILVNTTGTFLAPLTVELEITPTPVAGEPLCMSLSYSDMKYNGSCMGSVHALL